MSVVTMTRPREQGSAARELAEAVIGCKVSFKPWFSNSAGYSDAEKRIIADQFHCRPESVSGSKKLLDNSHPSYKSLTKAKGALRSYWESSTLPWIDPGVRLLLRSDIDSFWDDSQQLRRAIEFAIDEFARDYPEMVDEARTSERLRDLFDSANYPPADTIGDSFAVDIGLQSVTPPDYLARLKPEAYEREMARVQARFDHALELAEQSFATELSACVSKIVDTLGSGKQFKNSLVDNVNEFFDRFRHLRIGCSDAELTAIVDQAQDAIRGVSAQRLRDSASTADRVHTAFESIGRELNSLTENRRPRHIAIGGSGGSGASA